MPSFQIFRKQARHDRRGGRGEDCLGRGEPVELGKNSALVLDALRQILLDEDGAMEGIGEIGGRAHACECGLRIIEEAVLGEIAQPLPNEHAGRIDDIAADVIERDLEAAGGKHDRPGATDQPGSDDGDAIVHIHSIFLLSVRSSRKARDGPVQVTKPRSSTTVRSESASARSR